MDEHGVGCECPKCYGMYGSRMYGGLLDPVFERSSGAIISGSYRYLLWRRWQVSFGTDLNRMMVWVMLNPSTADAHVDDPTIRKCIGFAKRRDFAGIIVTNLFAYRATDPKELRKVSDPIGPKNLAYLHDVVSWAAQRGHPVYVGWGRRGGKLAEEASKNLTEMTRYQSLIKLRCFGKNADGSPKHPLMLAYKTPTESFLTSHPDRVRSPGS